MGSHALGCYVCICSVIREERQINGGKDKFRKTLCKINAGHFGKGSRGRIHEYLMCISDENKVGRKES